MASLSEITRYRAGRFLWPALLSLVASAHASAETALSKQDILFIERALGAGMLGKALAAPVIDDPADYQPLTPSQSHYLMLQGSDAGKRYIQRLEPAGVSKWRLDLSEDETGVLHQEPDGGLVMTGIEDAHSGALTRYEPGEPFMPKGFQPGTTKVLRMGVKVFDLDNPADLQHQGSLGVTLSHLGAYQVSVPAGTYETILLKASFHGDIGPAHVDDVQYRFFAKRVGLVAMAERRDVSAFVVYWDRVEVAKVLENPTPGRALGSR
jgi:hypothetical protein